MEFNQDAFYKESAKHLFDCSMVLDENGVFAEYFKRGNFKFLCRVYEGGEWKRKLGMGRCDEHVLMGAGDCGHLEMFVESNPDNFIMNICGSVIDRIEYRGVKWLEGVQHHDILPCGGRARFTCLERRENPTKCADNPFYSGKVVW